MLPYGPRGGMPFYTLNKELLTLFLNFSGINMRCFVFVCAEILYEEAPTSGCCAARSTGG